MSIFAQRLRECRNKTPYTQKEVAKLLDLGERQYTRYERDESEPTLSKLVKIADFYDVSLDYLTGRVDEP